ncbi:MAG: murein L,D-transpeptidase catalytic domain family protein [Aquimonas sp.]|nr:murein L,D-transpeptidase catalytic domain family protein [Aquimonas sp.]
MRLPIRPLIFCTAASFALAATSASAGSPLRQRLLADAPGLDPKVLELALDARSCAAASGRAPAAKRLAVIDYSRPSTEPRLWLLDVEAGRVLMVEHVAHGRGSGENHATRFSNIEGSFQTSLGLYVAAETYHGGNGYSLRLDGLDPGFNDRARERLIVIHGAPYVDPALAAQQGRLGRSYGCPAVRPEVTRDLIDHLKQGQLVFAYYPDTEWLAASPHLACAQQFADSGGAAKGESSAASAP